MVFLLNIYATRAQNTTGDEFLDKKEADIQMLCRMAEQNTRNECELLATCTTTGPNCTRHECWHSLSDLPNFECQDVKQSRWCGDTCGKRNFDFTKSFMRLSPTTDTDSMGTTMTICSQRALDPYFKQVSSPDKFVRVYFGAPSGTWRGFPGTDENECRNYDPRSRPWYLTSTSVKKVVIILVDTGASMGDSLSRGLPRNKTSFTTVKDIAREFLDTLFQPDEVMIIQFNAAAAVPLAEKPVQVITNETTYPPPHPELAGLKTALNDLKLRAEPGASNITSAIEKAESFLAAYGLDYLKVIMVLTDGNFTMSGNVPLPPTFTNWTSTKTFVYTVPSVNYKNFSRSAFPNQLCAVGGSFEEISLDRVTNPLYSIASFYSFMANLHASLMKGKVDYTQVFSDFTQINGDKFSVSKPAFGPGGELVGVVSITIYLTDMGTMESSVLTAMSKRSVGDPYNAANFPVLGPANCSIRLATSAPEFSCGSKISIPANGSLCEPGATTNNIQDLSCCGTCKGPPSSDKNNTALVKIVTPSVIIGFLALLAIIICMSCGDCQPRESDEPKIPKFPGDNPVANQPAVPT